MKILKGICVFLLSILAFVFVLSLSLSLIFKNVVQKGVVGSIVKDVIVEEFSKENNLTDKDKKNIEKVNSVIKTKDINELVDKVVDEYEASLDNENYHVKESTVDYVIDLLVEYKDLINDISGEHVTEKDIRSNDVREDITEVFNDLLQQDDHDNEQVVRVIITSYNFFSSTTFRMLLVLFIVVSFALIALVKSSFTKLMKPAASVFITNGVLISALYFVIMYAFKNINNSSKYNIVIDPKYILCLGIIEVIIGIIFTIVTIVTKKDEEEE